VLGNTALYGEGLLALYRTPSWRTYILLAVCDYLIYIEINLLPSIFRDSFLLSQPTARSVNFRSHAARMDEEKCMQNFGGESFGN
jgi:hypothetical protein